MRLANPLDYSSGYRAFASLRDAMYGLSWLASAPKKPAYRQRAARGFWSRQSIRNVDHEIRDTLDEIALLSGLSILPLETVPLGAIDLRANFSDTTGSRWRAYIEKHQNGTLLHADSAHRPG
jgi:hypothetical protein